MVRQRWRTAFEAAFPAVTVKDGLTLPPNEVYQPGDGGEVALPDTEIRLTSGSMTPDLLRWLKRNGVDWTVSLETPGPGRPDVHLSLSSLPRGEPRLLKLSGLVTVNVAWPLGELERWLNDNDRTLGLAPGPAGEVTLAKVLYGDVFVETCFTGAPLREKVAALGGVLGDGIPFRTRAVPRAATGPDFKHLFLGNRLGHALILDATLRTAPLDLGRANQWRWLRVKDLRAAADLMAAMVQAGHPFLSLHALPCGDGRWEVRMGYSRHHLLNEPMLEQWENATELALQSGPLSVQGDESLPKPPLSRQAWRVYSVAYDHVPVFASRVMKALDGLAGVGMELFKPVHDHLMLRLALPPEAGWPVPDRAVLESLAGLCDGIPARRMYPAADGRSPSVQQERQWLNGLKF